MNTVSNNNQPCVLVNSHQENRSLAKCSIQQPSDILMHARTHTHTHTHKHTHTHTHTHTHSMLQNYAKWQLTEGFLRVLNDTFAEPYFDFRRKFKPSSQSISFRAGMCLYILQEVMPLATLRLLAEDVLSENAMVC